MWLKGGFLCEGCGLYGLSVVKKDGNIELVAMCMDDSIELGCRGWRVGIIKDGILEYNEEECVKRYNHGAGTRHTDDEDIDLGDISWEDGSSYEVPDDYGLI